MCWALVVRALHLNGLPKSHLWTSAQRRAHSSQFNGCRPARGTLGFSSTFPHGLLLTLSETLFQSNIVRSFGWQPKADRNCSPAKNWVPALKHEKDGDLKNREKKLTSKNTCVLQLHFQWVWSGFAGIYIFSMRESNYAKCDLKWLLWWSYMGLKQPVVLSVRQP